MVKATFIQDGEVLEYTNGTGAAIVAWQVVPMGNRIAIAGDDIAINGLGSLFLCGVFSMAAVNDTAFAIGDPLYWDNTAEKLTTQVTDYFAGMCFEAKASSGTTGKVLLCDCYGGQGAALDDEDTLVVRNSTGSELAAYSLVYITGATSAGVPTVALADADLGAATHIITKAIADGATGAAYKMAFVSGLNTSGVANAGDPIYLSTTAGAFAAAAPTAVGDYVQIVGYAVTKHASTGKVLFLPGLKSTVLTNKVLGGVASVTGTLEITSGLASVTAATVTLAADAALSGLVATVIIPAQAGGDAGKFTIKVWKATANNDCTPVAADAAKSVSWVAFGT